MGQASKAASNYIPLKVAVIREELVALTRDPYKAVILNQLIYWSRRVRDFDQFLREEHHRHQECNVEQRHGWIYKSSGELIEETMLAISPSTLRRHLTHMREAGWIEERDNPDNKWDKVRQYRVNLSQVATDLKSLGYTLQGFVARPETPGTKAPFFQEKDSIAGNSPKPPLQEKHAPSNVEIDASNMQNDASMPQNENSTRQEQTSAKSLKNSNRQNDASKPHFENSNPQIDASKPHFENSSIETEITSEITQKNISLAREDAIAQKMLAAWNRWVRPPKPEQLTLRRATKLKQVLGEHFGQCLEAFEQFCEQISHSDFLMGRKTHFHVFLDWALDSDNLTRIQSGAYHKRSDTAHAAQAELRAAKQEALRREIACLPPGPNQAFHILLLEHFGPAVYGAWLKEGHYEIQDTTLVVTESSAFKAQWVETNYRSDLERLALRVWGRSIKDVYFVPASSMKKTLKGENNAFNAAT